MNARELATREREHREAFIAEVLVENGSNVARTARELGLRREVVERIRRKFGLPENRAAGPRLDGVRQIEKDAVFAALAETGDNIKATVRLTGVPESTVRRWRDRRRAEEPIAA